MIEVRPCILEDAADVSSLLGELGYELSFEATAEGIRRPKETGSDPTFIAEENGRPLGVIALHRCHMIQYQAPVVRITALVVKQQARRRGVGRLLTDHAVHWARQSGCEFIELTSALDRAEAHAFYRGLGFEANSLRFRKALGS